MIEIQEFGGTPLSKEDKFHHINNLQSRVMKALRRLSEKEVGSDTLSWPINYRNAIRVELDHIQRMIGQLHDLTLTTKEQPYISNDIWAAKYNLIEASLSPIEDAI